jgi:murein tripeptide amidase MpaA
MADIVFDRAPRFNELTEWLHQLAAEYPDLVELEVLGRSHEGRELWIATVSNRASGPHHEKPAIWLDGNIHASETTAGVALIHLIHHLCTNYGSDERVTLALDTRTFYIVPRVNPDGAELALSEVPSIVRSNTRAWPREEQLDGLVPGDIDHDGRQLQMRIADPNGTWKAYGPDPRLLVAREPDEYGPGPYYRLLSEGRIQHYDGISIRTAPARAGVDSNRNFPYQWKRYPGHAPWGAGDFPTSEPEIRAVVQGIVERRNIGAYFAYHTFSGVHLRPYGDRSDDSFPTEDLWTYQELGRRATEITGYPSISTWHDFRYHPKGVITGVSTDWAYEHLGLYAWVTEFWNVLTAAGLTDADPLEWYRIHPLDEELQLLAWVDENVPDGYVDWYPYDHPELGPVELGGWHTARVFRNPPSHLLEAEVAPHSELAVFQALCSPLLRLRDTLVEPAGEGCWRIRVVVENSGWLPTNISEKAIEQRAVLPLVARVALPPGVELVAGTERLELGQLTGRALKTHAVRQFAGSDDTGDRTVAEWLVTGPAGATCEVTVQHDRAGVVRASVTLATR